MFKVNRWYHFYSYWVLICHFLFLLGILQNTFVLAIIVCVGWCVLAFVYPNWSKLYPKEFSEILPYNILLHFGPLLFLPPRFENWHYFPLTVIPYLIVTPNFKTIYYNPFL